MSKQVYASFSDYENDIPVTGKYLMARTSNQKIIDMNAMYLRPCSSSLLFYDSNGEPCITRITNKIMMFLYKRARWEALDVINRHRNKAKLFRLAPVCMSMVLGSKEDKE